MKYRENIKERRWIGEWEGKGSVQEAVSQSGEFVQENREDGRQEKGWTEVEESIRSKADGISEIQKR